MDILIQYSTVLLPLLCYSFTLSPITIYGASLRLQKVLQKVSPGTEHASTKINNTEKEDSKKLRIAVVAPLFESIPPKNRASNGIVPTERTVEELSAEYVYNLVEILAKKGHDVTLFASSDSKTSAKLISAYHAIREKRIMPGFFNHPYIWMFEQIRKSVNDFDIIHFNTIEHLAHMKPYINKTLTTLHAQPGDRTVDDRLLSQAMQNDQLFAGANVALAANEKALKNLNAKNETAFWHFHIMKSYDGAPNKWQQIAEDYEKIYRKIARLNELQIIEAPLLPNNQAQNTNGQQLKIDKCQNIFALLNRQKPLRIAIVSPPLLDALPPAKGGGTERIVYYLTEQLAQRGNKVSLIAPIGTNVSANVDLRSIPYRTNPWEGKGNWVHHLLPVLFSQKYVPEHSHEFDILHFHDSDHFVLMRDFIDRAVVTRHLPIDDATFFNTFNHIPMVSISETQRKLVPKGFLPTTPNWIGTVHNGIPIEELTFRPHPDTSERPYLAWMGRMTPEKGVEIAIEFALLSGIKLKIAAQLVEEHKQMYWQQQIMPLINAHQNLVEYVGEVGGAEKDAFLGNALAFLSTPKWDEPFGLAMIEAMATGTPAIANRRGAVPEIVQIGRNGYTFEYNDRLGVEQVASFVHLINDVAKLDRAIVRQTVEQRWTLQKMAENYEEVYRQIIGKNYMKNCS